MLQPPQLLGSVCASTHTPEHSACGAVQALISSVSDAELAE
jgi:hypothetical protein